MTERNSKIETRSSSRISSIDCRAFALILVLAAMTTACGSKEAVNSFPASNSVPGWEKSAETRTYAAADLWKYIDGDADKYVQAGVVKVLTCDYRYQPNSDAVVDVFVMGDVAGARKIFASESSAGSQPVTVGDAGRYAKGSLTFRQGPYFVRLVAYEDSPKMEAALTALARAISARMRANTAAGK